MLTEFLKTNDNDESPVCKKSTKLIFESPQNVPFSILDPNYDESADELKSGHQALSESFSKLSRTVDGSFHESDCSIIVDACRDSLKTHMTSILNEASVWLVNTENKSGKSLRASLAQERVVSYLKTVESALQSREKLENDLGLLCSSIASQMEEEKAAKGLPVQISLWRTPSLCFDMEVAKTVEYMRTERLPLKVRVRAIAEIYAVDIHSCSIPSYRACHLQIKELKHESLTPVLSSGATGEGLIKIKISPLGDRKSINFGHMIVREARV